MRRKYLFLALLALLLVGGFWLGRTTWRTHASNKSSTDVGFITPDGGIASGPIHNQPAQLAPPDPSRRFREFTPEQRVEFARKGHGPGG